MSDQLDLFGTFLPPAPTPAPPVTRPFPPPIAPSATPPEAAASAEALHALAGLTVMEEVPPDRVTVGPVGWDQAMATRAELVRAQLGGTLHAGDCGALAALQRLHIMQLGTTDDGAILLPADALEHAHDTLAGLRLLAQPAAP